MVEDSIETFETFCTHQDLASLAAEQDLSTQFQSVLRTYASFTDTKSASSQARVASSSHMAIRWRNAGIRAMRGVVGSDEAQAADGGDCLKIVLPVILETMYSGEEDLLVLLQLKAQEPEEGDGDGEGQGQEEAVAQRRATSLVSRMLMRRRLRRILLSPRRLPLTQTGRPRWMSGYWPCSAWNKLLSRAAVVVRSVCQRWLFYGSSWARHRCRTRPKKNKGKPTVLRGRRR